jgi:hypothetical protein
MLVSYEEKLYPVEQEFDSIKTECGEKLPLLEKLSSARALDGENDRALAE